LEKAMKSLRLVGLAICCLTGLGCPGPRPPLKPSPEGGRSLTKEQLDAIVKPSLADCAPQEGTLKSGRMDPASIIPSLNAREFPAKRVAKTLNGMWRGRVLGDDSDVSVDYFWFIDTKKNEALIIAQRTGQQSLADMKPVVNAPKFSYLLCAHEGYFPSKDAPQLQEFVKVSDDLKDVPRILERATGLKAPQEQTTLAEMWNGLRRMDYFNKVRSRAKAFGGALFEGIQIAPVEAVIGPSRVSMSWDGTYFGGGSTAIKFSPDVPIKGIEYAQFVGTTTSLGDFLVASPGNGAMWKVEAMSGGNYDLGFDSVVLGPLE
jgi:hypothetical protein